MDENRVDDAAGGPVVSGGGRSPSTLSVGQGAAAAGGGIPLGLPIVKLEQWRQRAEAALEAALKGRETDPADGQLATAMQRIGELSMEVELLRARIARPGPLARGRSR